MSYHIFHGNILVSTPHRHIQGIGAERVASERWPAQGKVCESVKKEVMMTAIEKARELFLDAGLPFPSVPAELTDRLKELDEWLFATRPIDVSPYNLQHYVHERGRHSDDYLVLSHSGHGVNSYAIQYYLVHGCIRMFLHLGWGGVYMDANAEAIKIRDCFVLADRLVQHAELAANRSSNKRLTIVISDFYGSYWVKRGQKGFEPEKGLDRMTVILKEASDYLAATG